MSTEILMSRQPTTARIVSNPRVTTATLAFGLPDEHYDSGNRVFAVTAGNELQAAAGVALLKLFLGCGSVADFAGLVRVLRS